MGLVPLPLCNSVNSKHDFLPRFNTFYLHFLQVKNVDFDGLFGNISSVIDLSQRLLETLLDTDSIGKRPVFKRCTSYYPIRQPPSACYTLYSIHVSTINHHVITFYWLSKTLNTI